MTNFNERMNTLLYKNIPLALYSWKGWCFLCVRGELEMGTDCYILTQSSSSTIAALLSHSRWAAQPWVTEGHKPSVCKLILTLASCPPTETTTNCLTNCPKPSVASGYIIVSQPPASCGRTHTEFNHVHRSRWYSNIFDRMHLFHHPSAYLHRCISWLTTSVKSQYVSDKRSIRSFQISARL